MNQLSYGVSNPVTQTFISQTRNAGSASIANVINNSGVLAWQERRMVGNLVVTDIRAAMWRPNGGWTSFSQSADTSGFSQGILSFQNSAGVVCWQESVDSSGAGLYNNYVFEATCDPALGWRMHPESRANDRGAFGMALTTASGVVAWRDGVVLGGSQCSYVIHYAIYDPMFQNWQDGSTSYGNVACGTISTPSIINASVKWTRDSTSITNGYVQGTGWRSGTTTTFAYFVPSTTSGNAPLTVWFVDMSINAGAVSYTFGDGVSTATRSPYHTYSGYGSYLATQTAGSSVHTATILTDTSAPTGTVVINGGAATSPTPAVTLTLSATDNSGTVASMRFSNDAATWSPWEGYATSRNWTLTSGDGTKTVYAQFRDAVGNTSSSFSDSIVLSCTVPGVTYVDRSYTGTNSNGSICAPFPTVTQGYQAAQNSNTIRIFSGNYPETILNMNKQLLLQATNGVVNIGR